MSRRLRVLLLLLAVFGLVAASCSSSGDDDEAVVAADEELPPAPDGEDAPAEEVQNEPGDEEGAAADEPVSDLPGVLEVTAVNFETGVATITNTGAGDYDLTGHWMCNRPTYAELPSQTIGAGESIEASLGGFSADGGEVAIYTSNDFGSSDDIVTYVTWGGGGGRSSVAEGAGIWSGDPVAAAGDSISLTGDAGSAAGWG